MPHFIQMHASHSTERLGLVQRAYNDFCRDAKIERHTDTVLDRLTHHLHILEPNGDSCRLNQSTSAQARERP